jgi:hypothetical protein
MEEDYDKLQMPTILKKTFAETEKPRSSVKWRVFLFVFKLIHSHKNHCSVLVLSQ